MNRRSLDIPKTSERCLSQIKEVLIKNEGVANKNLLIKQLIKGNRDIVLIVVFSTFLLVLHRKLMLIYRH